MTTKMPTGGYGPPPVVQKPLFMQPGGRFGMTPEQEEFLSDSTPAVSPATGPELTTEGVKTEEFNVPLTETQLMGMGMAANRFLNVKWLKATPGISLTNVLPLDDDDYRKNIFMNLDEVENAQGEVLNLSGFTDYPTRLTQADKFGAVKVAKYDENGNRTVQRIPWENVLINYTKLPKSLYRGKEIDIDLTKFDLSKENFGLEIDIKDAPRFDISGLSLNEYKRMVLANRAFSTLATPDPELGKVLHAQYLNQMLIENGIDARGRALIIHQELRDPTMNELTRFTTGVMDVLGRSVVETGLYAVGETTQQVTNLLNLFDIPQALGAEGDLPQAGITTFKGRQEIADSWWKPLAYNIQESFAQQNVVMNLETAEDLARTQTGFLPFLAQFAAEIRLPSKAALAKEGFTAAADLKIFEMFARDYRRANVDASYDELVDAYTKFRTTNNRFLRLPFSDARRRKGYENRLTTAFQFQDANLPRDQRVEVDRAKRYHASLLARRDALYEQRRVRRGGADDEPVGPDLVVLKKEILEAEDRVAESHLRLQKIERRSSIPVFVRNQNIQDLYLTVGGATLGHFFDETQFAGINRDFGSLIGIGVGITLNVTAGKRSDAFAYIRRSLARSDQQKLDFAYDQMSSAAPELQVFMETHGAMMAQYSDELIAAGVDPTVMKLSLPSITGLVTLRHFENTLNQAVATKGVINSQQAAAIQEAYSLNQRLNGELNRVLAKFEPKNEAEQQFYQMIDYMRQESNDLRGRLDKTIQAFTNEGVGHFTGLANGNRTSILSSTSPVAMEGAEEFMSFPEANDSLNRQHLINSNELPDDQFRGLVNAGKEEVNREVTLAANQMTARIGNRDAAKRAINTEGSLDVQVDASPGGLASLHFEAKHSADKAAASRPYVYLDEADKGTGDAKYYVNGNPVDVSDVPMADTRDVFQALFDVEVPGVGPLRNIRKQDITPAEVATLDKTIAALTDGYFTVIADKTGQSKKELLKNLRAQAEDAGVEFPPGRNPQAIIANYLVEDAAAEGLDLPLFEMSPGQLRELDMTLTSLMFRHRDEGGTMEKLSSANDLLQTKFDTLTIAGEPVDSVQVMNEAGELQDLKSYLKEAGEGWKQFKSNWYDMNEGAIVPRLMSWGRRNSEKVTAQNPGGVRYNTPVDEFIAIENLTDPKKANRFMLSLGRALGQQVGDTGYVLLEGASDTVTAQAYLRAFVGEYIADALKNDRLDAQTLTQLAKDIEANIQMMTPDGTKVPMLNVFKVVDDTIGNYKGFVSKEVAEAVDKEVAKNIKVALSKAAQPAKDMKANLDEAVEIFSAVTGINADKTQVGSFLIEGGGTNYQKLKTALLNVRKQSPDLKEDAVIGPPGGAAGLKYTEEEVDEIIANLYTLNLRSIMFRETGREIAQSFKDPAGKTVIRKTPELTENPQAIRVMLGAEGSAQQEVVKTILGEERYKVWEATTGFLSQMQNNPMANSNLIMQGVPRALSIESYISRLYAINRGVVRPQYVGTEALLQSLRFSNYEFLTAVVTDPELGELVLEMIRIGKPLDPKRNARFEELLLQTYAIQSQMHGTEDKTVVDAAGRRFTVKATPQERKRFGFDTPEQARGEESLFIPSLDVLNTAP